MILFSGGGSKLAGTTISLVDTTLVFPIVLVTITKLVVTPRNMAGGILMKSLESDGLGLIRKDIKSTAAGVTGGAGLTFVTATLNCRLYTFVSGKVLNVTGA